MDCISAEEISEYLVLLKKIIRDDGKVFIKLNRDKNSTFAYLYGYDEKAIKDQLLNLCISDFDSLLVSTEPKHLGDKLYVWAPIVTITAVDGISSDEKLYIKTHIDEKKRLIVISFHRYNDFS